jgi:hypothetical protein
VKALSSAAVAAAPLRRPAQRTQAVPRASAMIARAAVPVSSPSGTAVARISRPCSTVARLSVTAPQPPSATPRLSFVQATSSWRATASYALGGHW